MPTDAHFRFSTYLALALSCAALGYAEFALLPEVAVFALLAVVALGVLYFLESRVAFLSIPAANRLGGAMGIVYLMWAAYRVKRELAAQEFANMGWQTFVVALCGPLVMVALVGKVARGDKHAGDYWTLHGVALAGVGLAAAFAEEAASFVLIGLYLAATVWSLTLLHLGRASGAVPPVPGGRQPAKKTIPLAADPAGHRTELGPAILCAVLAVAMAVPLYLLTPRSEAAKAILGQPRVEIGYAADQMVNLNQSGPLQSNPEVAFEFRAALPDGTPKSDVNPDQRWRGRALWNYSRGGWRGGDIELPEVGFAGANAGRGEPLLARRAEGWAPPNLGPGQFTLTFEVPAKLPADPLADPVLWVPGEPPPVATVTGAGPRGWFPSHDGTFLPVALNPREPRRYVQVYRRAEPPDAGPPFRFVRRRFEPTPAPRLSALRENPVPKVKDYADALVKKLIAAGRLPKDCLDQLTLFPKPEYREAVAREFAEHLSSGAGLSYTTDLRRGNPALDPVEDFLYVTKSGHCERFAAALALMLRSQGIPAVYVLGFKGCEQVEPGRYVVRQEFAHTWVEALVPKPGEPEVPGDPYSRVYHWVALDPTPGALEVAAADKRWWGRANHWLQEHFQEYVRDYTPEQRRKALATFMERAARWEALVAAAAAALLLLSLRLALRRRRAKRAPAPPAPPEGARWLSELLAALAAHGIAPAPGDTPLEFAAAASEALRARGRAEVADVPLAWVEAYYRDRFAGVPTTQARLAELEARLGDLRRALAT
jgi:transglutaminase-like putative cysteine protease